MAKVSRLEKARRAFELFGFLLVVWGFYRLWFRFPEGVEELVIKPILWLGVVWLYLRRDKQGWESVGWVGKDWWRSIYLGLGLGMVFAIEGILVNWAKYGGLRFVELGYGWKGLITAFGLSVATAISEETVFRGYILSRLREAGMGRWLAVGITAVMFAVIHLPIWIFVWHYTTAELASQFLISAIFGAGSGVLAVLTGSLVGPVVTHVVWGWAVALFR